MSLNKTFILLNQDIANNAESHLWELPVDGTYEAIFKEVDKDKTLKQLGALFGSWVKFLSNDLGESEDYVHRMLKARFLARIYVTDPKTPEQEAWVELLAVYQESQQQDKLTKHAKRISLKWTTLKQMKEYMRVIENHYAESKPLPEIDKYWNK